MFSSPFMTTTWILQGDILSSTLFNLFSSFLPDHLSHEGVCLDSLCVRYIMYADDLCLNAQNGKDLQVALNCLERYCDINNLVVTTTKTKLVIFPRGRLPKEEIFYKQSPLERVNEFSYLGITLSSQLSFSSHLKSLVIKANSRIGLLFSRLDLQQMPVEVLKKVFAFYIMPTFEYGLALWISGKLSSLSEQLVNSMFTKFWKRYLSLPQSTNNALVYYLTNNVSLMSILEELSTRRVGSIYLPCCMNGVQLSFFNDLPTDDDKGNSFDYSSIPSYFWRSRVLWKLPNNQKLRKKLCHEVCDVNHHKSCLTTTFHNNFSVSCVCKYCNHHLHAYHTDYNFCHALR